MLTGIFCEILKYIFTQERQTRRFSFLNVMAVMYFGLFSFTAHLSRLHETLTRYRYSPANIHTEVVCSSLNNTYCEDTSKVILLH